VNLDIVGAIRGCPHHRQGGTMKKRKFEKKLVISKETVANLDQGQMKNVYGGIITWQNTICRTVCDTDCRTC
jgi:hypothetical protein